MKFMLVTKGCTKILSKDFTLFPILALFIVVAITFSCLGFTEIDSKKSWCYEKLYGRGELTVGQYGLLIAGMCIPSKKKDNESQEAYDAYLKRLSEQCKDKETLQLLDYYLLKKAEDKCKGINKFEPTLHEPTS